MPLSDIRSVSDSVLDQLADRFGDLPRPLLAALGAGDRAVEQLIALRESLTEYLADPAHYPDAATVTDLQAKAQQAATDYAGKVQQTAGEYLKLAQQAAQDYAQKVQEAAGDLPAKAQQTLAELTDATGRLVTGGDLPQRAARIAADVADEIQTFATQIPDRANELVGQLPGRVAEFTPDLTPETLRDTIDAYVELVGSIYGSLVERGDRTWSKVRSASSRESPGSMTETRPWLTSLSTT